MFKILVFDLEKEKVRINLNTLLNIDTSTTTIYGMPDPFINACFVSEDTIFVNLYHKESMKHYHCLIDIDSGCLKGDPIKISLSGSPLNFPHDNFFDNRRKKVYIFYR